MLKKLTFVCFILFAAAQANAQLVPYYGKNNVKYDTFDWKTYKTTHFEIYFYPQAEGHLQRVASMAESAYDKISTDLQHEVEFKIPLIFFKTQSEFEQVNYLQISEGILGAAEPVFNRMAFAIDQPSDKLQELILHELTHVFEFSMLFGGILTPIVKTSPPLWVMEGFAEFETGVWDPGDLMVVRDAVLTERMPFLSFNNVLLAPAGIELGRAPYNIGHAAFEFMRERYSDAAVRQFWFYMKKAALLGSEDVLFSALGVKEETFNEQFLHYLRDRFKDYRDKQSPIDYGKEVALPTNYQQIFSQTPSPDGKEFAVMTANKNDYEFDILKIDRSGKVIKNLTGGTTTTYEYLTTDSYTFEGRNISWSGNGQRLAFFARTGKRRSLFVIDTNDGDRIKKINLKIDMAASPALSPDGATVLITGLVEGKPDMFSVDVASGNVTNLTNNMLYEKTPIWSADGKYIFYTTRIHSRDQIMRMNASNKNDIEQLTFADYDSTSPYYDPRTNSVYYASDKNGVFNIYRLDVATGDKIQYTDVIGGNFSPVVFNQQDKQEVAFTSYFKGQYRFFIMDLPKPVKVIAKGTEEEEKRVGTTAEQLAKQFGLRPATGVTMTETTGAGTPATGGEAPPATTGTGSGADYHPTKTVTIDPAQIHDKKFKMVIAGRPDVITGVSGDTFAVASGVVLQDILGDQQINIFTSRIRGFQSYNVGYLDLGHRLQFLTDFNFNDDFFFVQTSPATFDLVRSRIWGGRFLSQYPLNVFYRVELGAGIFDLSQRFIDPLVQAAYEDFLRRTGLRDSLNDGGYVPLSVALVGETTRFREFGPLSGSTFRLSIDYSPALRESWVSRTIYEADYRKYFRLSNRSLIAGRARAFVSRGRDQVIFSFGGGQDIRGFDFREVTGTKGGIGNLEYRFPLFPNPRIPLIGQMRGKVFLDYFRTSFNNDFAFNNGVSLRTVSGEPFEIDFSKGAGSLGFGFTVFAGGLPFNFDFSKVYGQGRFVVNGPTQNKFVDGINFDFSIGYDF
jgi:Tol biopolymer transport system component